MKASRPASFCLASHIDHVQAYRVPAVAVTSAIVVVVLALFGSLPARAQDTPRVQVFGGYSYTRFDSPSFGFANASNLNGYTFSPAYNIIPGFGVVAELSGQYNSKLNLRDLTVGPQILFPRGNKTFFGHLLIGDGRSFVNVGLGEGDTSRAVILGGGMDLDVTPRFAWRVFQVDYVHTGLFKDTQNNVRLSTGLVYRWHSIRQKGHRAPAPAPPAKQP
jgi:hypothetical protein